MNVDSLITTRCTDCGDVDLLAEQMWLVADRAAGAHPLRLPLPASASEVTRHHVDDETAGGAARSCSRSRRSALPAEALETHAVPPLTADDLIDLMVDLDCVADDCTC